MLKGFYSHFEALATFNRQDKIDTLYHNVVDDDNLIIESLVQNEEYAPVTQEEGSQAIKYINKGKSADYHGLTIEHILISGNNMINLLTSLLNKIFKNREIPNSLKIGLLSPIFKNKGSKTQSTNHRCITVLPVISKILEKVIKKRIQSYVLQSQSRNQRGFTAGASPLNSALPVEESYGEAIDNKSEYNIILLDAKAAFDTVIHSYMLRRAYLAGITYHR